MQTSKVGFALAGGLLLLAVGGAVVLQPRSGEAGDNLWTGSRETVGSQGNGRTVLPVSQTISPAGKQVELLKMRPQALALSPDGKMLVTSGKTNELVAIDPQSGEILQRVDIAFRKKQTGRASFRSYSRTR